MREDFKKGLLNDMGALLESLEKIRDDKNTGFVLRVAQCDRAKMIYKMIDEHGRPERLTCPLSTF